MVERPVFESRPGPPHTLQGSPRGGAYCTNKFSVVNPDPVKSLVSDPELYFLDPDPRKLSEAPCSSD